MADPIVALPRVKDATSFSRRIAVGASWLIGFRMLTRSLGVVSTLVLARLLVPADFGLIAMATTFSAAVDSLSQIGVQDALLRRPEDDRSLFDTAFTLQAARGLLTAGIIALAATTVARWFSEPRLVPVMLVLAVTTGLAGLENVAVVEYRRSLRYHYQFLLQAVPRIISFCVTVSLAFLWRNYWALIVGIAVSQFLRVAMSYALHPYRPRLSLAHWRALAGFSFWLWLTSLACLVWDRGDPFILGAALGPTQLGLFLLAVEVATLPVTELIAPAADVLLPGFAAAERDGTDTLAMALSVATTLMIVVAPLALSISAGAGYVVAALLGSKWQTAQPLIYVLAFICLFSPFSWVSSAVMVARGFVRHNFVANLVAAITKVTLLEFAVRSSMQMAGLAFVTVSITILEAVIFTSVLSHGGSARYRDMLGPLARVATATVASLCAARATGLAWQPVAMAPGPALFWGAFVGLVVVATFTFVQFGLWYGMGRPAGPDARLVSSAASIGRSLMTRLERSRSDRLRSG